MVFGGIQKLTLLDYPDKTACTVFTIGCNFNCPYCQNASLIKKETAEQAIKASEVLDFLKTRKSLLDGVCISGGEPLQQDDLEEFIDEVKAMGFLVKLDTNGYFPKKLEHLIKNGKPDYIAMDIKNTPEKYAKTTGLSEFDISPVEESITILLQSSIPYEFRTTVVREFHTADDLTSIAGWISGARKYCLQGFISSDDVLQAGLHGYPDTQMQRFLNSIKPILPTAQLRGT